MRELLTYGGSFMVLATASHTAARHCASEKYSLTVKHAVNPAAQRTANRHAKKLAGGVNTHRRTFVTCWRLFTDK